MKIISNDTNIYFQQRSAWHGWSENWIWWILKDLTSDSWKSFPLPCKIVADICLFAIFRVFRCTFKSTHLRIHVTQTFPTEVIVKSKYFVIRWVKLFFTQDCKTFLAIDGFLQWSKEVCRNIHWRLENMQIESINYHQISSNVLTQRCHQTLCYFKWRTIFDFTTLQSLFRNK